MPKLLDYNSFCENLQEVKTFKIMDKKKFHPEGLFSEQIFGPLKNYTCQCGIYHGVSKDGSQCDSCKVDIVNSAERRRRFAKIKLPIQVVNPIFYDLLVTQGGTDVKDSLDLLMKNENSCLYFDDDSCVTPSSKENLPEGVRIYEAHEAIYRLVEKICSNVMDELPIWKFIYENIDKLFLSEILVLPPDLRPAAKGVERNNQIVDSINRYYVQILTRKEILTGVDFNISNLANKTLLYDHFKQLQRDVKDLYDHILGKISKKEGLIRGNILGKRIDFSGRGIIIPDPTLDLDYCSIPYLMFLELFKLQIAKKLLDIDRFRLLNKAIEFVNKCINSKSTVLYRICEDLAKNEVCLLNRQPSLHRLGMIGFRIKISVDKVIKIHPLACPGFNADFDGDQMAVYIPVTKESKQEVIDKFLMSENLINPSDESLIATPSQDIILGIYMLTADKFENLLNKVKYKDEILTEGKAIFNTCLPDEYPVVNKPVGKKELLFILNDINRKFDKNVTSETLDKVKNVGFKYSTIYGSTLSLLSCQLPEAKKIRNHLYSSDDIRIQLAKVSSKETENLLKENFEYSHLIESGARGSWDQVRQIVLTRGFISNFHGQILPTPIKNSLLVGLTPEEFFNSTYGCRKGLLDVALNTGTSGYLSRKLIFTCTNLQLSQTETDCGTEDLLEVYVNTEKKAKMLIGRYYKDGNDLSIITYGNHRDFVGETIFIRSPILCKNEFICTKCYGELYKQLNSKFIGIIAAQALGECNTQLILRTFHTSGVAVTSEENVDMKQMDIVGDLSTVSKLLHKFDNKNYKDIVNDIFEVYNNNRSIHHVHFECVVSQLMWVDHKKWRLLENRDSATPTYHSVQTVPSYESWLLGLAFSNPKRHLLKGILNPGSYTGVMDKILLGEKIR